MPDIPTALFFTGFTFLLAGLVKGVIGLGLPTVAVGLLSIVMLPAQAASLLIVPSLVTNIWQLAAGPRFWNTARRLWPMMAGIAAGTWAGSGLMTGDTADEATIALGFALIVYAALGLAAVRPSVPAKHENWLSPVIGAGTGLVTAATGVFVIPAVPYLQALGLQKDDLVQALGLSFTVSTIALALTLAQEGVFAASTAAASLLALMPALAGMALGQWVRGRVSERAFRLCFFVGLLMLGGHLAAGAFT
ncbi:sulfite exporter TauE/SafE family protein [Microvirga roseola]|uniref:sulfite exporter TauE/SafE family protein n=1 Tax=Microvirga roseola TaxID=2883126 RepID=UPI001E6222E8|nr:sulfite exporter TauE/SafE family protein [Microvirga roseola]